MKIKLGCIMLFFVCIQIFGQDKFEANKLFKNSYYKKSAELYENIFKKGDSSKLILQRLGDSYYYNNKTIDAEKWYKKLIKNYKSEILPKYLFRYLQVLKSNGKYKESNLVLNELKKTNSSDGRIKELSSIPNYVSVLNNSSDKIVSLLNLSINTKFSDYGVSTRGDKFYFSSTRPRLIGKNRIYSWNNQPFYNIYEAEILNKNDRFDKIQLSKPKILSDKINTRYHDASPIFTKDGKTMYFTRDNFNKNSLGKDKNRKTHLKLYKATLVNNSWTIVEELPFNSEDYSIGHPALSPDEKTLYFISNMPGGVGLTDIYKVSILPFNKYSKPVNLGRPINTEGREMFPFVGNGNILYFSSDGHLGLGGFDIFQVKLDGESNTKVKNIRAPFNSRYDDFSFVINNNQTEGFFSSNRRGGKGDDDIYSFYLTKKESCKQNLTGIVTEKINGNIIPNINVKLVNKKGKVVKMVKTSLKGTYFFDNIPCKSNYKILVDKNDYITLKDYKLAINNINGYTQRLNLELKPLILDNEIIIEPIFFDFNKFKIKKEAAYELEKIVAVLKNNPNMIIKIESHSDSRGTKKYNKKLSDKRAKSTRDYILSRGIAPNRIASAIGYSSYKLSKNCDKKNTRKCTEKEYQLNRNSRFIIVRR